MATYTSSSRTIASAPAATFEAADETNGRQVFFVDDAGVVYWSRVFDFVSATSVVLQNIGNIPAVNKTISTIVVLRLSEDHTYLDHINEIKSLIRGYDVNKLPDNDIELLLARAVGDYNIDVPNRVSKTFAGNGTETYLLSTVLGSLWKASNSVILSTEWPAGETPASIIDSRAWEVYDDGSAQDGSNLRLRFKDGTDIAASDNIIVTFTTPRELPEAGVQNYPDTVETFNNLTLLAASYAAMILAAAYAPSHDAVISADVVNYNDKTRKYTELAKEFRKRYNLNVYRSESPDPTVSPAMSVSDLKTESSSGRDYLFHGRRPWAR